MEDIHNKKFIHRDLHSGNILFVKSNASKYQWQIGDLGLSQPANNTPLNNEIYGVIPYIAPEIFNGVAFSKASDVYSMAFYTSKALSSLISMYLSIDLSSISSNSSKEYISKAFEYDI
ncbi:8565_t:CDS:2 [Funneliformis geosporum]|uniref:non-specific serine/threonine protein kinase n=1 Tax=Funneliformis geosporum TaxID=1117311 RepID=A0A9W4X0D1_9GLOM|nr:8565_t:CDS:2 [Funneliformis geosporum]